MQQKTWIGDIIEVNDGTGDAILQFPDDFIAEVGWKEGTELNLELHFPKIPISYQRCFSFRNSSPSLQPFHHFFS
mgnify:CR=1 FL=1